MNWIGRIWLFFVFVMGVSSCELVPSGLLDGGLDGPDAGPVQDAGVVTNDEENPQDPDEDDQSPHVRFIQPTAGPVSNNLGVIVEASDPDGSIAQVALYINDTLVRNEGQAPYEWGTANSNQIDSALLNLAPGPYLLRAEATDNEGNTTLATLSITVDLCPDDPNKTEPGLCGCGIPEGTCDLQNHVLPSDTILVPPDNTGPIIAPITAYTWKSQDDWPDNSYELPLYQTLNRNGDDYWNFLLDELLLSRVDVVMFHGRGCWDLNAGTAGSGDLCPRHLSKFVAAVERAGAQDVIRVGMWDDTGAYNKALQHLENLPSGTKLNLADHNNWKYFWDHNIKIWFDTVPKNLWFLLDGKPLIAFWTLSDAFFSNQQGNASQMLSWIIDKFRDRYGVEPALILQETWFENDTTINTSHAVGKHDWFSPKHDIKTSTHTYKSYNGEVWGAVAPSFRNGGGTLPGCGEACREVTRRDGATLNDALQAGLNARFTLLEGWTDMAESAGFYRSLDWRYPTHYINIVRRYADPEPETLRFQAEGADRFHDTTPANLGGEYADRALDVGKLNDNSGWYVGWAETGEWLEYQEVELGCGTYRFTARVATAGNGKRIRLDVGGLPTVEVPATGGIDNYDLVHLGQIKLPAGTYDLRLVIESGADLNIDWFFLKRSSLDCN